MSSHETTAELLKLARLLGVQPERLAALGEVDPDTLRQLRAKVGQRLFAADREAFTRVGVLVRTIPAALSAKVAEKVLPPMLAARAAESLSPEKARDLAGRLPATFLADVARHLDPARSAEIVAGVAQHKITEVTRELARRADWVTMGMFVGHLPARTLRETTKALDGAALLQVWFVLDVKDRLDEIAGLLTVPQLDAMVTAAREQDLGEQLEDLLAHLGRGQRGRVQARMDALGKAS